MYTLFRMTLFYCRAVSFKRTDINDNSTNAVTENNCTSTDVTKSQELKTHIAICHVTTRSMISMFNESQLKLHETIRHDQRSDQRTKSIY